MLDTLPASSSIHLSFHSSMMMTFTEMGSISVNCTFQRLSRNMSVIKELKLDFSSIAWCPFEGYPSIMAIASKKDLVPAEEESPKHFSIYDWSLENVNNSKQLVEETLPSGVCAMSWGCTAIPGNSDAKGLICLGFADGSVQFWIPAFNGDNSWSLSQVVSFLCYSQCRSLQ